MPDFTFSQAMTANQLDLRPLANWKYRRLPYRALVSILINATTTGVRETIDAGAQNIKQKSPVQGGGTAGVIPIHFNTPVIQFYADPFDELIISLDEVLGGTPTVNVYVNVEPA
jgi:hypothetical protein